MNIMNKEKVLRMLGADELDKVLEELGEAQVTCEFCKEEYHIDGATLRQIRASL